MIFDYAVQAARTVVSLLKHRGEMLSAGPRERPGNLRVVLEFSISLIILPISLWALLSRHTEPSTKQLFAGFAGTVIGYWTRPAERH